MIQEKKNYSRNSVKMREKTKKQKKNGRKNSNGIRIIYTTRNYLKSSNIVAVVYIIKYQYKQLLNFNRINQGSDNMIMMISFLYLPLLCSNQS